MPRLFKPSTEATPYTVQADDRLEEIVKTKCEAATPPISVDEVALFNWGTREPKEILRALVELIGCKEVNEAQPAKSKLDPARGPGGTPKILLPKVWKKAGLAYEKVHKLQAKRQLPATAAAITSLDKWFLPAAETCFFAYSLEGLHGRAQKVDMGVYASNYAKATATTSGEFVTYAYADIPDTPILQKTLQADATEHWSGGDSSWKGESEAAEGILKPRPPAKRYINAASSPYTVMLRYYKDNAHQKAMLRLASFWPQWSGGTVVDASLKFKWTLKDCPGGMQGQFQIFDKDGMIVWRQALTPVECGNGDHEHNWTEGKALVTEAKMPYRVQIQVHTNKDTDPGLGLAAMHTEVRLFTHPDIGTHGVNHEQETQVLKFALAPFYSYNGTAPPEDSAKGRKLRLANAGYHPGPIEDGEAQAPYLMAVKEFQRDHAKPGVTHLFKANEPPVRLKADGTLDADTKNLIATQAAGCRPLFGNNARADITVDATLNTSLNDKATPVVLWVDDRQNYTKVSATLKPLLAPNMELEDYRGPMGQAGDGKQQKDATSICRPWIPVEVGLPIMRKADDLQTANPAVPAVTDSMRNATGPIRVDWTFRDLAPEYKVDTTLYTATRVRSLFYLTTTINAIKGAHNGKDAFNATQAVGGIRDADYYKLPFAIKDANDESLMPWEALADAGVSTICSVTHDDLGQDVSRLYSPRVGKAGVYLHPSIIGGDGYQFRAQVSFRDMPSGATHPNWKVLRDRYDATKLPQAHTAPMRLWRKDSYRAHIQWAAGHHWGAYDVQNAKFYEPGMVHWVYESAGPNTFRATAMYPGADGQTAYRNLVSAKITGGMGADPKVNRYRPAAEMTLTDNTIWPWSTAKHLGIQSVPPPGTTLAQYETVHRQQIEDDTWSTFVNILMLDLLKKVEQEKGQLRGHLICEFLASPQYWKEMYYCNDPALHDQILLEPTAAGGSGVGEPCRSAACTGTLASSVNETYACSQCGTRKTVSISANLGGKPCDTRCTGTFTLTTQQPANVFRRVFGDANSVNTTYTCNTCRRTISVVEVPANSGSRGGSACGEICPRHGTWVAVPGSRTPQQIAGPIGDLAFYSIGGPLGSLMVDTTQGPRTYWTHETAHHKHLEHAGDKIAHAKNPAMHDRAANTVDAAVAADPDPNSQKWDRDCTMSYVNTEAGVDRAYFCGKCLLKLRGWKIESAPVADPAGASGGP